MNKFELEQRKLTLNMNEKKEIATKYKSCMLSDLKNRSELFIDYFQLSYSKIITDCYRYKIGSLVRDGFQVQNYENDEYKSRKHIIQNAEKSIRVTVSYSEKELNNGIYDISEYIEVHLKGSFFTGKNLVSNMEEIREFVEKYFPVRCLSMLCSRIDLAINYYGLNIEDIAISKLKNNTPKIVNYNKSGRLNAVTYGSRNSDLRFQCYAKQLDKIKAINKAIRRFGTSDFVRVELTFKRGYLKKDFVSLNTIYDMDVYKLEELYRQYEICFNLKYDGYVRNVFMHFDYAEIKKRAKTKIIKGFNELLEMGETSYLKSIIRQYIGL